MSKRRRQMQRFAGESGLLFPSPELWLPGREWRGRSPSERFLKYHGNPTCCCECWTASDDFNRADSGVGDDWGPLWDGSEGVGNISGNTGKLDSGYMLFSQTLPDIQGSSLIDIELINPQDGDKFDVYLAWKDPTHFLAARFEVDTGNGVWIQQISQNGTSWYKDDVELISPCGAFQITFLGDHEFNISYDHKVLRIGGTTPTFDHYELWKCFSVTWSPANIVGLAHGGGPRPIFFDNFAVSDHYVHNKKCPFYGCVCQQ